jgi:hypothetical protein
VIDEWSLRPRRGWYVLGAALAAVGLIGGAVVIGFSFGSLLFETELTEFDIGEPARFRVDPDEPRSIYVSERFDGDIADISCTAEAVEGGAVMLEIPDIESSVFDEEDTWVGIYDVEVTRPGDYSFDCNAIGPVQLSDSVAFGPRVDFGGFFAAFLAGGLLALVGLGAGGTILIVVAVRRSRQRRRLQQQAWRPPPPGPWPPAYPGYPPGSWPPGS